MRSSLDLNYFKVVILWEECKDLGRIKKCDIIVMDKGYFLAENMDEERQLTDLNKLKEYLESL